jgi:hypothetical protein
MSSPTATSFCAVLRLALVAAAILAFGSPEGHSPARRAPRLTSPTSARKPQTTDFGAQKPSVSRAATRTTGTSARRPTKSRQRCWRLCRRSSGRRFARRA